MIRQIATASAIAGTAALLVSCAASQVGTAPIVPENLRAPAGQALALEARATGVQIYGCNANKTDPTRFEWIFKAPEADLFDNAGRKIGKHYAGPTWEALAGGKVVGAVKANAPAPEAGAIAWLLLDIKSSEGSGVFNQARGILRVATHGGIAPAQCCDAAHAGEEARVPYTATYLFLK